MRGFAELTVAGRDPRRSRALKASTWVEYPVRVHGCLDGGVGPAERIVKLLADPRPLKRSYPVLTGDGAPKLDRADAKFSCRPARSFKRVGF